MLLGFEKVVMRSRSPQPTGIHQSYLDLEDHASLAVRQQSKAASTRVSKDTHKKEKAYTPGVRFFICNKRQKVLVLASGLEMDSDWMKLLSPPYKAS